ncbi:hypothetical protein FGO68_gene12839 [Halteria grandinella]|uniref:Uncharacterized protein n=1 Tax=Halteria grandinella TaxID=5974 RepID=A0A8J8SZU3_HALGN|nr:hypothetical protein FGO68_gene12839 [Halteria grandinella]
MSLLESLSTESADSPKHQEEETVKNKVSRKLAKYLRCEIYQFFTHREIFNICQILSKQDRELAIQYLQSQNLTFKIKADEIQDFNLFKISARNLLVKLFKSIEITAGQERGIGLLIEFSQDPDTKLVLGQNRVSIRLNHQDSCSSQSLFQALLHSQEIDNKETLENPGLLLSQLHLKHCPSNQIITEPLLHVMLASKELILENCMFLPKARDPPQQEFQEQSPQLEDTSFINSFPHPQKGDCNLERLILRNSRIPPAYQPIMFNPNLTHISMPLASMSSNMFSNIRTE